LFSGLDDSHGRLDVVLYNASYRARGAVETLDPADVQRALAVGAFGGFLIAQAATRRMLRQAGDVKGTLLFTGASASVKGYPQSSPFAMAKFALRGLGQSLARELSPKGIHVCHVVIDGGVRNAERGRVEGRDDQDDSLLDPDAIASTYLHVVEQPRSAWTSEIELRPWVERF
jgi:NAD(P)-dependent dehydrogenase (short-subunit alcohol dehydrogenase family)